MALPAKIEEMVKAEVLNALGEKGGNLVVNMAREVMDEPYDPGLGGLFLSLHGGRKTKRQTYIEHLAEQEVNRLVREAVVEWFAAKKATLQKQVERRINVKSLAKSYIGAINDAFENGTFEVNIGVERSSPDYD